MTGVNGRSSSTSNRRCSRISYPVTPDARYFVHRGILWRCTNPALDPQVRQELVGRLMAARRAVGVAKRSGESAALVEARAGVDAAKVALGERGPVWWDDGMPDYNRRAVAKTLYAAWFAALASPAAAR